MGNLKSISVVVFIFWLSLVCSGFAERLSLVVNPENNPQAFEAHADAADQQQTNYGTFGAAASAEGYWEENWGPPEDPMIQWGYPSAEETIWTYYDEDNDVVSFRSVASVDPDGLLAPPAGCSGYVDCGLQIGSSLQVPAGTDVTLTVSIEDVDVTEGGGMNSWWLLTIMREDAELLFVDKSQVDDSLILQIDVFAGDLLSLDFSHEGFSSAGEPLDNTVTVYFWAEPVPEPATIALLAFGGMGLLRKR